MKSTKHQFQCDRALPLDGARHLCRFNVTGQRVLEICNPSLFFTLKRRERRAPVLPCSRQGLVLGACES